MYRIINRILLCAVLLIGLSLCIDTSECVSAEGIAWYNDYTYTLIDTNGNGTENYINLKQYNGTEEHVYIPASATINGITYRTRLTPFNQSIWYSEQNNVISLEFEPGCTFDGSASFMFTGLSKLERVNVEVFDMSEVTALAWMFAGCSSLTELNVSGWNVSNVVNMFNLFGGCEKLASIDVSMWNTSKVNIMTSVFSHCISLKNIDVSNWDVSNVTTTDFMFYRCDKLESLDLHKWNTSNITNMSEMFGRCYSLCSLNVKGWDTSKVESMEGMFVCNYSLQSLDISSFDMSLVKFSRYGDPMFTRCAGLKTIKTPRILTQDIELNVNLTYAKKKGNKLSKKEYDYIPKGNKSIALVCRQSKSKKTNINSIKSSDGKIKIKWKKIKTKELFTPIQYEVQCSSNEQFTDSIGKVMYTTNDTYSVQDNVTERTKTTIKNLEKGKCYYVRVRVFTYGKRLSDWSSVKKIIVN